MTANSHIIRDNLETIIADIHRISVSCNRDPETVRLVTVSKTIESTKVKAAIDAGATLLGENYIQEARAKIEALKACPVTWHFIGHLQSNKAKYAVKLFDLIHTVDSLKLAEEINRQALKIGKVQKILIQVNLSGETTKSGTDKEASISLIRKISPLKNISVMGLMTMPPFFSNPEKARPYFRSLRMLAQRIEKASIPNVCMKELSMGMTGDYVTAIEEGATLVRIGTAIFGKRK